MPHDASRSRIVISTRCRGRSVARVTRMRSRAGAVKRPRASSSRAVRTERRRRRRERTARRTSTRDSHRASPAPSRSRVARRPRASFPHPNVIHPRARGNDARDIHSTRGSSVVRRSSVRRDASRECREKKRALVAYLARRTRAFARSRVRARRCAGQRPRAAPRFVGVGVGPSLRFIFLYVRVDTALKRV